MKYFLNYLFDICSYLKQDLSGFTKNNTAYVLLYQTGDFRGAFSLIGSPVIRKIKSTYNSSCQVNHQRSLL